MLRRIWDTMKKTKDYDEILERFKKEQQKAEGAANTSKEDKADKPKKTKSKSKGE